LIRRGRRGLIRRFREESELIIQCSSCRTRYHYDESRFAGGRLAMLLSSRRSTTTFRSIDGLDWDVAPLPALRERAGVLHSDAFCLARDANSTDAAWRFVEFALGPEGQRIMARTGRTVPSLVEVARSDAFLDPAQPPQSARVFLDAIPVRAPTVSTWLEIEDASVGIRERLHLGTRSTSSPS
jgi:multiple sugar transport system substrate-binding protein